MKDQGYGDQFTFNDNFGDGREIGNGHGGGHLVFGAIGGDGTGAHPGCHIWNGDGTGVPSGDTMNGDGPA